MSKEIRVFLILITVLVVVYAQPHSTEDFAHGLLATGDCNAVFSDEGNAIDIFDISGQENPAASHFNEAYNLNPDRIDKIGGADKFSMDISFSTLEYPGPEIDGEKRSWYWVDGISRIMVEKGVSDNFSMRFLFRGGYNTMRKSWQDGYAPWPSEYRHNYQASVIDWSSVRYRASTTGAGAIMPLGEMYATYHSPFGLSIGAGGGYGFSEYEDLYYSSGWHTVSEGPATTYDVKFGARYNPVNNKYLSLGLNYTIKGGTIVNEEDDDYDMYLTDDNSFGFQIEAKYPQYARAAIGYKTVNFSEEYLQNANDEEADIFEDKMNRFDLAVKLTADQFGIPLDFAVRYNSTKSENEEDPGLLYTYFGDNIEIAENNMAIGLSAKPFKGFQFGGEYNSGSYIFEISQDSVEDISEGNDDYSGFTFGLEVFPVEEFGVRVGFENYQHETDSTYEEQAYNSGYILPFGTPVVRYGLVPDIEDGLALSTGFILSLDDHRLQIELSGKYHFASDPEIYKENEANRYEGSLGLTYYLK